MVLGSLDQVMTRFVSAVEASVDGLERSVRSRGAVDTEASREATSDQLDAMEQRLFELEESLESCKAAWRMQGKQSLADVVRLAQRKEREERARIEAEAARLGVDLPQSMAGCKKQVPAAKSGPSLQPQPVAAVLSPVSYPESHVTLTPPRKKASSDADSVDSFPPTPTLEDFGLQSCCLHGDEEDDDIVGSGCMTFPDEDDNGEETMELTYITELDLERLPAYLSTTIDLEWLNHCYSLLAATACSSPSLTLSIRQATSTIGDSDSAKSAILALVTLSKLESAGGDDYRLVRSA